MLTLVIRKVIANLSQVKKQCALKRRRTDGRCLLHVSVYIVLCRSHDCLNQLLEYLKFNLLGSWRTAYWNIAIIPSVQGQNEVRN